MIFWQCTGSIPRFELRETSSQLILIGISKQALDNSSLYGFQYVGSFLYLVDNVDFEKQNLLHIILKNMEIFVKWDL